MSETEVAFWCGVVTGALPAFAISLCCFLARDRPRPRRRELELRYRKDLWD